MPAATERFSNRVADYVAARPGYPAGVIDALRDRANLNGATRVADVGAGTGVFARQLLDEADCEVIAVEPNDAMRDVMIATIGPRDRFRAVAGTAEATTLDDASVDLVTAAQAFHWFDRVAFRRECRRILVLGGRVAILFNDRLTEGSPFLVGYEQLLAEFGTDYANVNHRRLAAREFAELFGPGGHDRVVFTNVQRFDFAGLKSRLLSSSYAPAADDPRAPAMLDALQRLFDATNDDGIVEMVYETQLSIGRVN